MGEKWFIEREGVAYGPADASELSQWIKEGRLDWGDLLWPENADRSAAIPAHTALQALGLVVPPSPYSAEVVPNLELESAPPEDEIPVLETVDDSFEIPVLPSPLVGDKTPGVRAGDATPGEPTPVPEWLKSLAEGLEADRSKPQQSSGPDWLEDVRQTEKGAGLPLPRSSRPRKNPPKMSP